MGQTARHQEDADLVPFTPSFYQRKESPARFADLMPKWHRRCMRNSMTVWTTYSFRGSFSSPLVA